MADYAKLAATAKRLIEKNGRTVTLKKRSTTPADATQPWRGQDPTQTVSTNVVGIFTLLSYDAELRSFVRRGKERFLVAAASTTEDLTDCTVIVDGTKTYEIESVRLIQPGDTPLVWEFDMKR